MKLLVHLELRGGVAFLGKKEIKSRKFNFFEILKSSFLLQEHGC